MSFRLLRGAAVEPRCGILELSHGSVETPAFMPVGTRGTVKAVDMRDLERLAPQVVLANTYHLWTDPGHAAVAAAGGLNPWTGWRHSFLTDSGGYQVVSLARIGRAAVEEEGVVFDGGRRLTPEDAVAVQEALAPDVMMVLDQPVDFSAGPEAAAAATGRTHRWAARCREAWSGAEQLWGIVQGGFDAELRARSARVIADMDFPGYAVGGLSLGEPADRTGPLLQACTEVLPADRPRYLMGVGTEREMLAAIGLGVDLFDCVWPTRLARTGAGLVGAGRVNLKSSAHARDFAPIEADCTCSTCSVHSRAQLRQMLRRGELLGLRLLTIHNLHHTLELVRRARTAIADGRFAEFVEARAQNAGDGQRAEGRSI